MTHFALKTKIVSKIDIKTKFLTDFDLIIDLISKYLTNFDSNN